MTAAGTWHLSHHLGLPIAIFIGEPSAMVRVIQPTHRNRFVATIGVGGFEAVAPLPTLGDVAEHLRSTGEPVELTADAVAHLLSKTQPEPYALVLSEAPDPWEDRKTAILLSGAALTLVPFVYLLAAAVKWGIR